MGPASSGNTVSAATAPFLEARAIDLWRGERHLLRRVSFFLEKGESLQLVGPNGVGKSSLLRIVCGLLPSEAGEVLWQGRALSKAQPEFQVQLAYFAHANALKQDLTALENLVFSIALRRHATAVECESALDRVGLYDCMHVPARALSAGQRRRLGLARIMLSAVQLWVLDEPATNLDGDGTGLVARIMEEHIRTGGAILCAAHHLLLPGTPGARLLELN